MILVKHASKEDLEAVGAYWSTQDFVWNQGRLIPEVEKIFKETHPRNAEPTEEEVKSWSESAFWLSSVLYNLGLGKIWLFIEYLVDPSMNPIDVVLAGYHPDGRFSFAVIELKQWSSIGRPNFDTPKGLWCRDESTGRPTRADSARSAACIPPRDSNMNGVA